MRKWTYVVLVLALVMQLFTPAAFAEAPSQLTKTATKNEDGSYTVALTTDRKLEPRPLDIVLVIDRSKSMETGDALQKEKAAAKAFVEKALQYNPNNQIGVVTFTEFDLVDLSKDPDGDGMTNYRAGVRSELSNNQTQLTQAIDDLTASGATYIAAGLSKAKEMLAASPKSKEDKFIILMTDGAPNVYDGTQRSRPNS